jgi:two-component system chemotaxis sensor kinase CheA
MNGTNPICLLDELRALGECKIVAQIDAIPVLEEINPEFCYIYWDVILTTLQGIDAIKDVFIFVADDCELNVTIIDDTNSIDSEDDCRKLGKILVERGDITQDDLKKVIQSQKRIGELLVGAKTSTYDHVQSALVEQQQVRAVRAKKKNTETTLSIKVPSAKLDSFVDLAGELIIAQERLSQFALEQYNPELLSISEEIEQLTGEIRDSVMSIRMVPIGTTFNKFKRLVHDLSRDLGREVDMVTDGAETELDKTVIERLSDPLIHLIRNSIDHGIEPPERREAIGKPRRGTILLSAVHSGYNILIRIKDDGRGLDPEAIRAKAIENGLITEDAELTEKELFALIFTPGFSTAKEITNVSGRGVGMDVVKSTLESLRSSIKVNSQCGVGTTITIKLPLTLAIIEGLLVEVGDESFVLPLSFVEECVELTHNEIVNSNGRHIIYIRGEIIPYINLRNKFTIEGTPPSTEQVVIVRVEGVRVGFVVDRVKGEQQTMIKTLGKVYEDVQGVSGATILGNGHVALILDIPRLIEEAESEQLRKERR